MNSREAVVSALVDTFFPRCPTNAVPDTANPDDLVVSRYLTNQGTDTTDGVALQVLATIEANLNATARRQLYQLLWLLSTRSGTIAVGGRFALGPLLIPVAFPDLPLASREGILRSWSHSNFRALRKAFLGLKGLCMSTLFTQLTPEGQPSPILKALHYKVTDPDRPEKPLSSAIEAEHAIARALVDLSSSDTAHASTAAAALAAKGLVVRWPTGKKPASRIWMSHRPAFLVECDAIVVGSGAGGGVTAAQFAAAGLRVVVLEKGGFIPAPAMSQQEGDAFRKMFECGGFLTTEDGGLSVLAGSTVGGGTRINWNASFQTPPHVRREWSQNLGLSMFEDAEYDAALAAVCSRLHVRTKFQHGGACSAMAAGMRAVNAHHADVPRNCVDSRCSGYCTFGCARGGKQDSVNTYLADACGEGARLVTGVWVEQILTSDPTDHNRTSNNQRKKKKVAGGVLALAGGATSTPLRIAFLAPIVVSCAGAIHSPALLLRSRISCRGIVGTNLRLHPCTCVVGLFGPDAAPPPFTGEDGSTPPGYTGPNEDGTIRCHEGPIMSVFSREEADWEGSGYGCVLYTPATHPGLFAAAAPWLGGSDFKRLMLQFPNAVPLLILVRDTETSGRVKIDAQGRPRLHYTLSPRDKTAMMRGMQLGLKSLASAGASVVMTLYNGVEGRFMSGNDLESAWPIDPKDAQFEAYLQQIGSMGIPDLSGPLFSAHQMATARVGTDESSSVLDPNGECWEVDGLFCCDASVFPTSLGVNPMITIEAVAHVFARRIARRYVAALSKARSSGRKALRLEYDDFVTNGGAKL